MNKYLYPIKNLKTHSYIKWWLYNYVEKLNNFVLSEILTGTEFYLDDSINKKFKIFDITGRSTQDGEPTPENPVEIKSCGDNGSINERIVNKNWWINEIENGETSNGITVTKNEDGSLTFNGTATDLTEFYFVKSNTTGEYLEANQTYTMSGVKNTNTALSSACTIGGVGNSSTSDIRTLTLSTTREITKSNSFIRFAQGTVLNNYTIKPMLEQGSTATDFVAHQEQNISFPLAQGQKLMQGDYLADDGVHHVKGEVVFDGSEDEGWRFNATSTTPSNRTVIITNNNLNSKYNNNADYLSNMFIKGSTSSNKFVLSSSLYISLDDTLTGITSNDDNTVKLTKMLTYLSNHNVTVQYELAQEVIEPYTEEQQTAWEQIKALRTYKGVTHISSEDETPAELKIQYYKEG